MWEDIARFVVPVYGVYRCHNCNWRGWLPRSATSTILGKAILFLYMLLCAIAIVGIIVMIVQNWPAAKFEY